MKLLAVSGPRRASSASEAFQKGNGRILLPLPWRSQVPSLEKLEGGAARLAPRLELNGRRGFNQGVCFLAIWRMPLTETCKHQEQQVFCMGAFAVRFMDKDLDN
jgi:hypothetical protein